MTRSRKMAPLSANVQRIMRDLGVTGYSTAVDEGGAHDEAAARRERDREARHRRLLYLAKMGAPEFVLSELATSHHSEATRALGKVRHGLAVISGIRGTGKTLAALQWLHRTTGPIWYTEAVALNELAPWDPKPWAGKLAIVVDDVGREREQAKSYIEEIVGYAHGKMRCTLIMTTNLSENAFHARYRERAERRIKQRPALANGRSWVTVLSIKKVS